MTGGLRKRHAFLNDETLASYAATVQGATTPECSERTRTAGNQRDQQRRHKGPQSKKYSYQPKVYDLDKHFESLSTK